MANGDPKQRGDNSFIITELPRASRDGPRQWLENGNWRDA
jgi:hypothetical protein